MATQAESEYNLRTVARRVADSLGIKDAKDMELDQRQAYNRALIAEILKYPNAFTADILNRAATMNTDYGYRGNAFDSALSVAAASVGSQLEDVAGVGNGVLTAFRWSSWFLPLAAVAFVVILLWGEINKRKGPPAAHA